MTSRSPSLATTSKGPPGDCCWTRCRGRISTSAGSDQDITTIVELAHAAGLRTGIVTTASVTDATPAAFATHINFRYCQNPDAMVDVTYHDIVMGDCSPDLKTNGGKGSIAEQLAAIRPEQRLFGLFSKDTVPVRMRGEDGRAAEEPEPSLLNYLHP